ncbi:MAG: LLM class flavin-dependent oxidoreductase [Candidatus Thorarchaeota archaeon]|nr:MAG: LLM class flavin-dependent oxidoreductase [Candidatus Thorarchaeota archaeon]
MNWGLAVNVYDTVQRIAEKCVIADQGGIDWLWVTDFPAVRHAPSLAAIVAENVKRSRIGVGLVSPLLYRPEQIVQFMSTLIDNYGERFDLLIGPGDKPQLSRVGIEYGNISTLVPRLVSDVTKIRDELGQRGYDGVRVWLGAQGPKMIAASINADGVLLNYTDPKMLRWALSILGDIPKGFQIGAFPPALITENPDCGKEYGLRKSAATVAMGLGRAVALEFGLTDTLSTARRFLRKKQSIDQDIVDAIDAATLKRFALCTTPEGACDYVKTLERMGLDMVTFGPPQGTSRKLVKNLVKTRKYWDDTA